MQTSTEAIYPIAFRNKDLLYLASRLKQRDSVGLVGMKRVGISNFLRFFLYHEEVKKKYLGDGEKHLLIPVDLNDLVERDVYPFWILLLKRIVDRAFTTDLSDGVKKEIRKLFTESIQLKDHFYTVDSVQKALGILVKADVLPTIFLLRFDRLNHVITPEFYGNLQRLKDASQQKLSFVFTSFRPLYELAPQVITKASLSVFAHTMYLQPGEAQDMETILVTFIKQYGLKLSAELKKWLIDWSGGHVQYLQLMAIKLRELKHIPADKNELYEVFLGSEDIALMSEELYASLSETEQKALIKIINQTGVDSELKSQAQYLWNSGILYDNNHIFSPLFGEYIRKLSHEKTNGHDFTRKEHTLLTFLESKVGELCERDEIIAAVWPDQAEAGVSDWAIDRLVSRVRAKLKKQNSQFEIVTVITRGYKLVRK
ncbi:helix-turn-helix domain-containing protein [Candidatus Microgenomates bacterium]|nr:MAG: helix-turn-helix domain-containing protein [Candidatus Microgenomates bacterium]